MLSIETMKWRLQRLDGAEFPLVGRMGTARVVDVSDTSVGLLVAGRRAEFTWGRVRRTWERLLANHELSVSELGGGDDAYGLVALLAYMQSETLEIDGTHAVLRPSKVEGMPVRQPTAPRS